MKYRLITNGNLWKIQFKLWPFWHTFKTYEDEAKATAVCKALIDKSEKENGRWKEVNIR